MCILSHIAGRAARPGATIAHALVVLPSWLQLARSSPGFACPPFTDISSSAKQGCSPRARADPCARAPLRALFREGGSDVSSPPS